MKTFMMRILKLSVIFILMAVIIVLSINFYVLSFSDRNYFSEIEKLPISEYGLVFGASVNKDGSPSLVLRDRLNTGILAYKNGKVKKLIVSGFASNDGYNEPIGMKKYLENKGIPKIDILIDERGIDTYNSLLQAKKIIGNKKIILFTQDFQLQRATYISYKLGLNFFGMETNLRKYRKQNYFREFGARIKAFWEVEVQRSFKMIN